jgi:hypothetical protein
MVVRGGDRDRNAETRQCRREEAGVVGDTPAPALFDDQHAIPPQGPRGVVLVHLPAP